MFYTNAFLIEPFNYKIARRKRGEALNDINTLTADYEYSRSNRETLHVAIRMQLFKKVKIFCQYFVEFLETTLNFEHFEKKLAS